MLTDKFILVKAFVDDIDISHSFYHTDIKTLFVEVHELNSSPKSTAQQLMDELEGGEIVPNSIQFRLSFPDLVKYGHGYLTHKNNQGTSIIFVIIDPNHDLFKSIIRNSKIQSIVLDSTEDEIYSDENIFEMISYMLYEVAKNRNELFMDGRGFNIINSICNFIFQMRYKSSEEKFSDHNLFYLLTLERFKLKRNFSIPY